MLIFINYKIMNTNLTNNLRTHIVYIKNIVGNDAEEIHITKAQYDMISEDIKILKYTDFYTIQDIDTKKTLFNGQRKDILRFKEKKLDIAKYNVICDFGQRHPLINGSFDCKCGVNYGYFAIDLQKFCRDKYKVNYPNDITSEMRKEFYIINKKSES